jgi:hypothetical protein
MRAMEFAAYPPLPCRASPPQGGRFVRRADIAQYKRLEHLEKRLKGVASVPHRISTHEGEMPGRAEGGISLVASAEACAPLSTGIATPC